MGACPILRLASPKRLRSGYPIPKPPAEAAWRGMKRVCQARDGSNSRSKLRIYGQGTGEMAAACCGSTGERRGEKPQQAADLGAKEGSNGRSMRRIYGREAGRTAAASGGSTGERGGRFAFARRWPAVDGLQARRYASQRGRMRPGGRPGLQNRRLAADAGCGGFDSHSLPLPCARRPAVLT